MWSNSTQFTEVTCDLHQSVWPMASPSLTTNLSKRKGQCCSLVALGLVQTQVFSDVFSCSFLSYPVSVSIKNLDFTGCKN